MADAAARQAGIVELRLAVVCYGGVSLAVYMHGITKEIQKLVAASAAFEGTGPDNPFKDRGGSEKAWWDLLDRLSKERVGARKPARLRVVVDIVAGTSAGGINGVFLAKGLSQNRSQNSLRQLWMEKADIAELLRNPRWLPLWLRVPLLTAGILVSRGKTESPLRGDAMCEWLHEALDGVDFADSEVAGLETLVPHDQRIQLFVPVTDVNGYEREVPVDDPAIIRERAHRVVLEFASQGSGSSLGHEANHGLAFAARATSSFPGGFSPVSLASYRQAVSEKVELPCFKKVFRTYDLSGDDAESAWFMDGGVLDNHPIDCALDAISKLPAHEEVDRRLVYIEPDPKMEPAAEPHGGRPGLVGTIWAGYAGIPRQQPLVDQLERVARRNHTVGRLRDVIVSNFHAVSRLVTSVLSGAAAGTTSVSWLQDVEQRAEASAGLGLDTYTRLRLQDVLDSYTSIVASSLDFTEDSYQREFVDATFRGWARDAGLVGQEKQLTPDQRHELARYDLGFYRRRIRFVIAALNWWYRKCGQPNFPSKVQLDKGKDSLYKRLAEVDHIEAEVANSAELKALLQRVFPCDIETLISHQKTLQTFVAQHRRELERWRARLHGAIDDNLPTIEQRLQSDFREMTAGWDPFVIADLLTRYVGFPFWDVLTFPVQALSGVGERDEVAVMRISPEDSPCLPPPDPPKLHGASLGHFGAFFSRSGRETDYLWGRLDAAARLTTLLLDDPDTPGVTPAEPAVCRPVFDAILDDEAQALDQAKDLIAALKREVAKLKKDTD